MHSPDDHTLADQELPDAAPVSEDGASRKRHRRKGENLEKPAKRSATIPDVLFRLLVPSNRIGKVIGKQGVRIKQLREETGARIKIADPLTNVEERVVLISSKDESCQPQCVAEQALIRVATLVIEPETGNKVTTGPHHHEGPNMTRLLIAGSQAGGVIGKAGATIKEIRESSGAHVRVLTRDQFPIWASASETDRLVQMYGEIPQVQRALELIAAKLRENPPREVISTNLNYHLAAKASHQQILPPLVALSGNVFASVDAVSGYGGHMPMQPKITVEMNVASDLIGGIIGKGGANITRIRQQSGASIKVSEQEDGALERAICFEGTSNQVTAAQTLVQAFLDLKQ